MVFLGNQCGARLRSERERLGYSQQQLAALAGVTDDMYTAFEDGKVGMPLDFSLSLRRFGVRPEFIGLGEDKEAQDPSTSPAGGALISWAGAQYTDSFPEAVRLMQRSIQAVEAFVGAGCATSCPQLVAALMETTVRLDYSSSKGEREELVRQIADGLEKLCEGLAEMDRDAKSTD